MSETREIVSVITCDLEGRIETFNPNAEKLFGYSADEVIGKKLNKTHEGENQKQSPQHMKASSLHHRHHHHHYPRQKITCVRLDHSSIGPAPDIPRNGDHRTHQYG